MVELQLEMVALLVADLLVADLLVADPIPANSTTDTDRHP